MKKYAVKIIAVVLMVLAIAGVIIRVNSASLALTLGGYSGNVVIIEEGFTHISDTSCWQVLLAEKDGETRLAVMEQGFLGFWKLPEAATGLNGEYEGLEYITVSTLPPCGNDYGYDPYVIADTMTHTDNWKFATEHISRADWFYHGNNAAQTLMLPDSALPKDSTLQIYQNGQEYVLHLCQYCKGNGSFDGGFDEIYQALLDNGSLKEE